MNKISILMYHQVGEFPSPAAHRAVYCHVRRFKAQMAWLHHLGYPVIGMDEALEALRGERTLSRLAVVLTFDDGYLNFCEHAFPVLERYGFPATVYLISSLVGKKAQWLADDGREAAPLMDRDTIRRLAQRNITFGCHTRTHPKLSEIDGKAQEEEIVRSKGELEAWLDRPVRHFCYPFGRLDDSALAFVRDAGYDSAVTCIRGTAVNGEDPHLLPRKAISFGDSLAGFLWKLHMKHKKKINPKEVRLADYSQIPGNTLKQPVDNSCPKAKPHSLSRAEQKSLPPMESASRSKNTGNASPQTEGNASPKTGAPPQSEAEGKSPAKAEDVNLTTNEGCIQPSAGEKP